MLTNRKRQIFVTLLAVLSLFVSAVSACACSHHSDNKDAALDAASCHGAEHGEIKVEKQKPPTPSEAFVGQNCACFVRTPVQVIASKGEQKKFRTTDSPDDILSVDVVRFEFSAISSVNVTGFDRTSSYRSNSHLRSGPARAPPRL